MSKDKDNNLTKDYLEMIDSLSGVIGSKEDSEIESAVVDLGELKEYVSKFEEEKREFIEQESKLNDTILNLRKANNKLMRKIAVKDEKKEEYTKEEERIKVLKNLF